MKKLFSILFALSFLCHLDIKAENSFPPPYDSIEVLPYNPIGWYYNGPEISKLFSQHKPKVVIEVGCWAGLSTIHMASLLPSGGVIYAVDHWLGSEEHQPGQPCWSPTLPFIYQTFLSNVIHAKQTDKIIPLKMTSVEASEYLAGLEADLIYIDAAHDYDNVYADLNAWYPFVKGHGILCGDDWFHPPIKKAVNQFAQENGLKVHNPGCYLWFLEEKK